MDDLMHSLVEALSNDKDAYEYNSEVYSDPYTGKVRSGGERGGISFPDPGIFLSQVRRTIMSCLNTARLRLFPSDLRQPLRQRPGPA